MHQLAAPGPPPAALEQDMPAGTGDSRDAPALVSGDSGQEPAGVAEELAGDEPVDHEEEAGLVGSADLRVGPEPRDREVGHAHPMRQAVQAPVPHAAVDRGGGVVVRDVDHRVEDRPAARVQSPMRRRELAQVRDEKHGLDHAGADEAPVDVGAACASLAVDHREGRVPAPAREGAARGRDARRERESRRSVAPTAEAAEGERAR